MTTGEPDIIRQVDARSGAVAASPNALMEASWEQRGRRMEGGERRIEGLFTLGFCLVATLLVGLAPGVAAVEPGVFVLVVAYAIFSRIEFPVALAGMVPTQLILVPLFFAAPAQTVPVLVAIALALGGLLGVAAGQARVERLLCVGGDAAHSVGPACVLVLLAGGTAHGAAMWVLALALLAQFACDLLSGVVREYLISGVAPRIQTLVQVQIWAADLALAPIGYLAARGADGPAGAAVALLPLVGLLAFAARDRRARIATAHQRLGALEVERERLRLAVRRIGEAFASNLEVDGILDVVVRTLEDALQAGGGRVRARGEVLEESYDGLGHALCAAEERALRAGYLQAAEIDGVHALACPMHSLGAVLSIARRGEPFGSEERSLAAYLSGQADVAGSNAMRHSFVQRQAVTDELTDLANHRSFQQVLDARLRDHERHAGELALMLVDLDDFKLINDRHGHLTGDALLREVGRCLRESCRTTDRPARYGGEEFAVVLDGLAPGQVLSLAERVRKAIAESSVISPGGQRLSVSASIGIARMNELAVSRQDLIAAADAALYDAKRSGKDRVAWVDLDASDACRLPSRPGSASAAVLGAA